MGDVGLFGSDWKDKDPTEDAASVKGKRNLYVNPPRRGGCGYSLAERTIGGKAPQYMPDPYQNGRQLGKELRRKARERIAKPFNAAPNAGSGLFNPNPHTAPPGPLYRSSAERGLKAGVPEGKQPFRQPGPPGKGAAYCTLSKVGQDYVMQPPEEKPEVRLCPVTGLHALAVMGPCHSNLCLPKRFSMSSVTFCKVTH